MSAIEAIKATVTIHEVIDWLGLPHPRGKTWHCPVTEKHAHGDRTPSAQVVENDRWRCFGIGCGAGGDVLDLVEVVLGLTPREAIRWITQRSGHDFRTSQPVRRRKPTEESGPSPAQAALQRALTRSVLLPAPTTATVNMFAYLYGELDEMRNRWRTDGNLEQKDPVRCMRELRDWYRWATSIIRTRASEANQAKEPVGDSWMKDDAFSDLGYRKVEG